MKTRISEYKKYLALVAFLAGSASLSSAATINIDFQSSSSGSNVGYSGTAAAPDTGTTWNIFTQDAATGAALVDSNNTATTITLTKAVSSAHGNEAGSAPTTHDMMQDYLHDQNTGNLGTITFGGLTDGLVYDLYLYGHGDGTTQFTGFTIAPANANGSTYAATSGAGRDPISEGDNYVVLRATVVGGEISYDWGRPTGSSGPHAAHNGVQLVLVPEPSSAALLGLGGLALIMRRRK